jgi:hypothetical protein
VKFRAPLLIIVGAATAIVLAAAGAAVVAWRRGCALADEEAEMLPPDIGSLDDHRAASARSEA